MASTTNIPIDSRTNELTVVIDEREFERALEDPQVRELHAEADALLEQLRRDGRDY